MPSRQERNALLFLAAVAVLGAGTRSCGARGATAPIDNVALERQIGIVDSLRARGPTTTGKKAPARSKKADRLTSTTAAAGPIPVREPGGIRIEGPRRLDVDVATREELLDLPGVGPAIAERILAERILFGPFGCLAALQVVRGIGPATLRKLDTLVTFSGSSRRTPDRCRASRSGE
jgi:competence protein ComEA